MDPRVHPSVFETFFDLSADMLAVSDLDGVFRLVNGSWERTLGWTAAELQARPFIEFVHPDDVASTIAETRALAAGRPTVRFENRYRTRGGQYRWLRWNANVSREDALIFAVARDVTDAKRDELLLEQSQAVARIGGWQLDLPSGAVYWTRETHVLFETDPATYRPTFEDVMQFFAAESRPMLREKFTRMLETGESYDLELDIVTARGNELHVRAIGLTEVVAGVVVRIYGTMQDVTAARNADQAVRRSEAFLSAFMENVPAMVYAKGVDGRYIVSSGRHYRAFGRSREEIVGRRDVDLVEAEMAERFARSDRAALESGLHLELSPARIGGVERTYETTKFSLTDANGEPYAICGISRDVTERLQLERELKETLERFEQVTDTISEVFWMIDVATGRLIHISPAYETVWGRTRQSVLDDALSFLEAIHPEDQARVREALPLVMSEGGYDVHYRILRPDGTLRHIHDRAFPVRDKAGAVYRVAGIALDITAQKEAEELIGLQQAKIVSASKMSALGEMAAGIAHEINNPLAIIDGKARQLKSQIIRGAPPDKLVEAADVIAATAQRIARIVRGLRTFARGGEGDPFQDVPLRGLLESTLAFCQERFKHQGIALEVGDVASDVVLECREAEISQVVLNLLSNAFDAVRDLPERWVRVSVRETSDAVEIAVTDSGRGIAAAVRQKIMQPFYTTKAVGKGTGLGLSISKGIAEAHGGFLVYDERSAHTRFVLLLPREQAARSDAMGRAG